MAARSRRSVVRSSWLKGLSGGLRSCLDGVKERIPEAETKDEIPGRGWSSAVLLGMGEWAA